MCVYCVWPCLRTASSSWAFEAFLRLHTCRHYREFLWSALFLITETHTHTHAKTQINIKHTGLYKWLANNNTQNTVRNEQWCMRIPQSWEIQGMEVLTLVTMTTEETLQNIHRKEKVNTSDCLAIIVCLYCNYRGNNKWAGLRYWYCTSPKFYLV